MVDISTKQSSLSSDATLLILHFSVEHFSRRPLFRFLIQPDVISAINPITADNIFNYYQQERPDSDFPQQFYHAIAKDLEEVLKSNFFKDTTRVLKDIKY